MHRLQSIENRGVWYGKASLFVRDIAASMAFIVIASGCSMPINAASDSIQFICTVKGAEKLAPDTINASVCGTVKQHVDKALPKVTKAVETASGEDWIKVDVRFAKPATILAVVTRKSGGTEKVHPEIAVDVMDKSLSQSEVEMLAREVAKQIAAQE